MYLIVDARGFPVGAAQLHQMGRGSVRRKK